MKRLYLASIGLTAGMMLAAVSVATAAYGDAPSADPTARSASGYGLNNVGPQGSQPPLSKEATAKANLPAARLMTHVQIAPVCQQAYRKDMTFAGPACPMYVIVPVGSPWRVLSALRRVGRRR
jgi:hypothetical protein